MLSAIVLLARSPMLNRIIPFVNPFDLTKVPNFNVADLPKPPIFSWVVREANPALESGLSGYDLQGQRGPQKSSGGRTRYLLASAALTEQNLPYYLTKSPVISTSEREGNHRGIEAQSTRRMRTSSSSTAQKSPGPRAGAMRPPPRLAPWFCGGLKPRYRDAGARPKVSEDALLSPRRTSRPAAAGPCAGGFQPHGG